MNYMIDYMLKICLFCIIGFFLGAFFSDLLYRISYEYIDSKKEDLLRCFKFLFAAFFLIFSGLFFLSPNWMSVVLRRPIDMELMYERVGTLLRLLPYGFFILGGALLVYAVRLFVRYRQEYK